MLIIIAIIITRPNTALKVAGLVWIVAPYYSLGDGRFGTELT